jgi:multidrug efflux pump subunit AcrA (membrane-fusion protein)
VDEKQAAEVESSEIDSETETEVDVEETEETSALGSTLQWMSWEASEFIRSPSLRIFQWTILALAGLTGLCLVMASFIQLDIAIEAAGEITSAAFIREVYPQVEGYVSQIDKKIGDDVEKNQIIAHLSTGDFTEVDITSVEDQLNKSIALIEGVTSPGQINDNMLSLPSFRTNDTILSQRFASLEQAHRNLLEQRGFIQAGLAKEIDPLVERKKTLEKTLVKLKSSKQKKFMSYYVENTADEIRKLGAQIATIQAQYDTKANQALSDFLRELRLSSSSLKTFLDDRLIKAPITGKIVRQPMLLNSRVIPGTSVSSVIPQGAGWVARVKVRSQDIVWLKAGQPVLYKVDSYPFERYGLFEGEIQAIDVVREDSSKADSGFVVTGSIRPPSHLSSDRLKDIKMVMGLSLSAKIITGRETITDMILDHVYPSRQHSQ